MTYPEEYYEELAQKQYAEMYQAEYEAYLEEFRRADGASEDYWSKNIGTHNFDTIKDAFREGFISGWFNKKY